MNPAVHKQTFIPFGEKTYEADVVELRDVDVVFEEFEVRVKVSVISLEVELVDA